jgi:hypothetical protein
MHLLSDVNAGLFILAVLIFATVTGASALQAAYFAVERERLPAAVRWSD